MSAGLPMPGERLPAQTCGPFDATALRAFAEASGDDNPLHLDPAVAAAAGLARPPVHGMLMVACLEPALHAWRPELRLQSVSCKFLRPVLVGDTVTVTGRVLKHLPEGDAAMLRLQVHGGTTGDLAVLAEAVVRAEGPA